jgi:hypothetical protein
VYAVLSGEMTVGTTYRTTEGARGDGFAWWIAPAIASPKGFVPTLDEAKAELAANWRKWLA